MNRLFIFDMDGTLLPNTTAMVEIAKITGHTEELEWREKQYLNKEIDNNQFAKAIYDLWQNLTPEIVKTAFKDAPKINNIEKALQRIDTLGGTTCLITASPDFFADHFYQYGFDYIIASKPFNLKDREFTPERILHAKDKPIFASELCQKLKLPFEDSIAFGDSLSDIPLFQALKHTISVNGDAHIKDYAKYHYIGLDLMDALSHTVF